MQPNNNIVYYFTILSLQRISIYAADGIIRLYTTWTLIKFINIVHTDVPKALR